jgi:hypothetical protein
MVVYTCNPSTWEAKAGGSWVQVQTGLHRETLSQKGLEMKYCESSKFLFLQYGVDSMHCALDFSHSNKDLVILNICFNFQFPSDKW